MELTAILILVVALVCPITMGLMMWRMNKEMGKTDHGESKHPVSVIGSKEKHEVRK